MDTRNVCTHIDERIKDDSSALFVIIEINVKMLHAAMDVEGQPLLNICCFVFNHGTDSQSPRTLAFGRETDEQLSFPSRG
jgi:hypothetical protein